MRKISSIVALNLFILLFVTLLIKKHTHGFESIYLMAWHIGIQVILNFAGSIYSFNREAYSQRGKALLLSSLVVLIIGFSACMGL